MNIVAHNILAMNAQRMYGINTNSKKKSSEKLSSGYKINRAADDAAGLSISEKMRKRIRGLNQGSDNLKDGVSLCQTADGALMEVEDMIHRINELAIKAANGTNSQSDREDINSEISELKEEMTRVFNTTKFNETYIFKAPYVPDVQGEPTDYELFNGPDGSTPAGVLINHKRYTFGELGVPSSPTADWIKEIVDPDNPDELIRLKLKAGDSPENIRRVYVMTADDTGIKVNNLYAGLWDSTIKEDGKTLSFTYRGMDVSIETESEDRAVIIDRLRGDNITENSWDAIPIEGDGNSAVRSSSDSMTYYVTNSNKNSIENWSFQIKADSEGVELRQTSGDDGLTHTKIAWKDFSNVNSGDSFPISDWGTEDEGNNPVTMDSSARYRYVDGASAGYLVDGMEFDFSFLENEVAKQQAINGLTQNLIGSGVISRISSVTSDAGARVTNKTGFDDFTFQRDKLLRDFGVDGSDAPMTITVERTLEKDGTVKDHEWRRTLSAAYAKRIETYTDTQVTTYNSIASTKFYNPDDTEMTDTTGFSYDQSLPSEKREDAGSGSNLATYDANTGLSADWTNSTTTTKSSAAGTDVERREVKNGSGAVVGYVDITFNTTVEVKRTTNSSYEKSDGRIVDYVQNGVSYSPARDKSKYDNKYYVRVPDGLAEDTDGKTYREANDSDGSVLRYVMIDDGWVATKTYDLDHYSYSGKNSGDTQIMSQNATDSKFLNTGGTATSITIHDSFGNPIKYNTENTASVLNATLSGSGNRQSLSMNYDTGLGYRINKVTVTPAGKATKTFTKSATSGGSSSDTNLIVKVNPPVKKLELQATDVNLESEREILEWTPLSNSILGLSGANTKTIVAARATISCVEEALKTLN
ncbi:MAG: flagellin, partial [Lachnospiraceae bacterium]|nr:flagellin [Lachnospiraceae bacterium]